MSTFNFRLDKKTREKLDIIANKYRRSRADVIRLMIEDEVIRDVNFENKFEFNKLSEKEKDELIAGENKYNLNGDL